MTKDKRYLSTITRLPYNFVIKIHIFTFTPILIISIIIIIIIIFFTFIVVFIVIIIVVFPLINGRIQNYEGNFLIFSSWRIDLSLLSRFGTSISKRNDAKTAIIV